MRLSEVPVRERVHAALVLSRQARSEHERLELLAAAIAPSDRPYYVPVIDRDGMAAAA